VQQGHEPKEERHRKPVDDHHHKILFTRRCKTHERTQTKKKILQWIPPPASSRHTLPQTPGEEVAVL
jgi:hypothetical protein